MTSLLEMLAQSRVKGSGDGVSDSVPAVINEEAPVALSEGEYIIRADVVSALGGGATDPGHEFLDKFQEGVLSISREDASLLAQSILETINLFK